MKIVKRELGKFETGATFSDENEVFNIVGVLFLEGLPTQEILRRALNILQERHPFLRVRIVKTGRRYAFKTGDVPPIQLEVHKRHSDEHWVELVNWSVNHNLDRDRGPLLRCDVLAVRDKGEIILTFHHSIVDGPSVRSTMNELLQLCAVLDSGEGVDGFDPLDPLPPVEDLFPPAFQGFSLKWKILPYLIQQLGGEFKYQLQVRSRRIPPIHEGAQGRILPMRISAAETDAIVRRARKERVTLNSVVNAAMLLSVQKYLYDGTAMPYRYLVPSDLRPYTTPPTPQLGLGGYVSPMRFTIPIREDDDLWSLASGINEQIYTAGKRGERFLSSYVTDQVMRMIFGLNRFRMCTTALTYSGTTQLMDSYGRFKLSGMRGFTSNFGLGPEYSGQVHIYKDELWWDILFLDTDMDHALATRIADEIRTLLITGLDNLSNMRK